MIFMLFFVENGLQNLGQNWNELTGLKCSVHNSVLTVSYN